MKSPLTLYLTVLSCFLSTLLVAQTVSIDATHLSAGPYVSGNTIAVPVNGSELFYSDNTFELYLSDASGSFASEALIGSYNGIYADFVNGTLPAGLTPGGNYKVRVKTTSPASVSASFDITIGTGSVVNAGATPTNSDDILVAGLFYGWCTNTGGPKTITFSNLSTTGAVTTATLINEQTGAVSTLSLDNLYNQWRDVNLDGNYYTLIVNAEQNGVISTRAYTIINSPFTNSLTYRPQASGCIPSITSFFISTDPRSGVGSNYPGLRYLVEWGDNTSTIYSLDSLRTLNGDISHQYRITSCGNGTGDMFTVRVSTMFPISSACSQPSSLQTTIQVFMRPESHFEFPNPACVGTNVVFTNTSVIGNGSMANVCTAAAKYVWYVDGVEVYNSVTPIPGRPSISQTFMQPGRHVIRLDVSNSPCGVDTHEEIICVEDRPRARFTMTGADTGCVGHSVQVDTVDINRGYYCNPFTTRWHVYDRNNNEVAPGSRFTVTPSMTAGNPTFTFRDSGLYYIDIAYTNSCGDVYAGKRSVYIIPRAQVVMQGPKAYCGSRTIDFYNINHQPFYSSNLWDDHVSWEITAPAGATYSYTGATDSHSKFPSLILSGLGTYKMVLTFTNRCNVIKDSQLVRIDSGVTSEILRPILPDTAVCYTVNSIQLSGEPGGAYGSVRWSTSNNGTFTTPTQNSTTYNIGNGDRSTGWARLSYTVNPVVLVGETIPNACPAIQDTVRLRVYPRIYGTDRNVDKCSGVPIDEALSSVAGTSYTWTASARSGSASGFHSQSVPVAGGAIRDVIINDSRSVDAVVRYVVTPYANGCTGEPFTITVTIKPTPLVSVARTADTICSGATTALALTSSVNNTTYRWTSVAMDSVTGNSLLQVTVPSNNTTTIADRLVNVGNVPKSVRYAISVAGVTGCQSPDTTVAVWVWPRVTPAAAGDDQYLCNQTSTALEGNDPIVGTGTWTQIGTTTAVITNPHVYNTTITNLRPEVDYTFRWLIDEGKDCGTSEDVVMIYNRPEVEIPVAGTDIVVCDFTSSTNNSTVLHATPVVRSYERGTWSVITKPAGSSTAFSDEHDATATFFFNREGAYTLKWEVAGDAQCTPQSDLVDVNVYAKPEVGSIIAGADRVCEGADVTLSLPAGSYTGVIKKWQYNPDPVRTPDVWRDTLVDSNSPTITFENVQDTFAVRAVVISAGANAACPSYVEANPLTIYVAALSQGGYTVKSDSVCISSNFGTVYLENQLGSIVRWETSLDNGITWNSFGNAGRRQVNFNNITQSTLFRAVVQNGVCSAVVSDSSMIKVKPETTVPVVTGNATLCNIPSTTLTANAVSAEEVGVWTPATSNPASVYSDLSNPVLTVSAVATAATLPPGLYSFTWSIDNGACPSQSYTFDFTVSAGAIGGSTSRPATFCIGSANGTITLSGQRGTVVEWQMSTDNEATWSTATNTNNSTSYSYFNLQTTTAFRAVVINGNCTSPVYSSATTITVKPRVTVSDAGADKDLCNVTQTGLSASTAAAGETARWTQSVRNITGATLADATSATTTVSGLRPGNTYTFIWTMSNGTCADTRDSIEVIVRPALTNTIHNADTTVCEGTLVSIPGNAPTGGNGIYTYQWQYSTDGTTWQNFGINSTAGSFSLVASNTIYIRRMVTSGPCVEYSPVKILTVKKGIGNNHIDADTTLCYNELSGAIRGSDPTDGGDAADYIYVWEESTDGGVTWVPVVGANSRNYDAGRLTQTTLYRRKVSTQMCFGELTSTSNIIAKTVNNDARAEFSVARNTGCAPFEINRNNIVVNPFYDRNSHFQWMVNGVSIGTSAEFPGYTVSEEDDSVTVKLFVTSTFGCKNDSLEAVFYSYPVPQPQFIVSEDNSCGPYNVRITNQSKKSPRITYTWDFGNGQTSALFDAPDITYDISTLRRDTIYHIKLIATNECATEVATHNILVRAKPRAAFTPSQTRGCSPFTVDFNNNSLGERVTYTWYFADGSRDSVTTATGLMRHTYVTYVQDTFRVRLIAVNECGADTSFYNVIVTPNLVRLNMSVNGDERIGCTPLTVNFMNNTRGATSFRWDFGDGNVVSTTENIETVRHIYTQPGKYKITLIASNGCTDTTGYEAVESLVVPVVDFTPIPSEICVGDSLLFRNDSPSALTGSAWNFGDGHTSSLPSPKHAYQAAGTFTATLVGTIVYEGGNVCSDRASYPIRVMAARPGMFTVSDTVGNCVPFTVTFTNISKPSALTRWNFGDGSTATGDVVSHTYTSNNTYLVTMSALHPEGCTFITSRNILIQGPEGNLAYDNGYICKDKPVRFEVFARRANRYEWVFGDGDTLVTASNVVFHTYKQSGIYIPSVQLLSDECGVWLYGDKQILVDYYQAGFNWAQQQSCGNSLVAFTDSSRSYFGIQDWSWNFGDGGTGNGPNAQHTYNGTNTFPAQLVITGTSGCRDTVRNPVSVKPNNPPIASVNAPVTGCEHTNMTFRAVVNSEDEVTLYAWNFSNRFATNGPEITTAFNTSGNYQVQLVAGTKFGCYDTVSFPFFINPSPILDLGNDVSICRGQSTQLMLNGAPAAAWSPLNDLSCGTCLTPVASPAETRKYFVRGTNAFGCSSMDSIIVNVVQPSKVIAEPFDTICLGQTAQLSVSGFANFSWTPAATLNDAKSATPVAFPTLNTRYQVIGTDAQNCFRDTAYVTVAVGGWPTVDLGPDRVLSTGTELRLTPTVSNGPIISWMWAPSKDLSCNNCPSPVATVKTDICYVVNAENIYHCAVKDTMCIQAFCESTQVYIPNAFVPGSTTNGLLMVRGQGIRTIKTFRIFNRWGQVVFERSSFPPNDRSFGWDGRVKGIPASPDVYVYTCEVVCEDGKAFTYKGNVAILK